MRIFQFRQQGDVVSAALRFREELIRREARAVSRMLAAWRPVARGLRREIGRLEAEIAQAQRSKIKVSEAWLMDRDRAMRLLGQIEEEVGRYSRTAAKLSSQLGADAGTLGMRQAASLIASAGFRGVKGAFDRVNAPAVEAAIGALEKSSPLQGLFRSLGAGAVAGAREVMVDGIARGRGAAEIAKRLESEIERLGPKRAIRIARTEGIRAYRVAAAATYAANSDVVQELEWLASKSPRTCAACLALDGRRFAIGTVQSSHVACRCTTIPVTRLSESDRQTGEDWLDAQPEAVQRKILGRVGHALKSSGHIALGDFLRVVEDPKWGPSAQIRTNRALIQIAERRAQAAGSTIRPHMADVLRGVPPPRLAAAVDPSEFERMPGEKDRAGPPGREPAWEELFRLSPKATMSAIEWFEGDPPVIDDPDGSRAVLERWFGVQGLSDYDIANLVGAPQGATITMYRGADEVEFRIDHPWLFSCYRSLARYSGQMMMHNAVIETNPGAPKGLGRAMVALEIHTLEKRGVLEIRTSAARQGRHKDGYHVWPTIGFDGQIPDLVRAKLPKEWRRLKHVRGILAQPGGPDWWKINGATFAAVFRLNKRRPDWRTLKKYMARKSLRFSGDPEDVEDILRRSEEARAYFESPRGRAVMQRAAERLGLSVEDLAEDPGPDFDDPTAD